MKIRHPFLIKSLGFVAAGLFRAWMNSLRYRVHCLGPNGDPYRPDLEGRFIYSIWHETLIFPVFHFRSANIAYLISRHADGQLLAEIGRHLRVPLLRGSTTRG